MAACLVYFEPTFASFRIFMASSGSPQPKEKVILRHALRQLARSMTLGIGNILAHHLPTASLKSSKALSSVFSEELWTPLWRGKWWTELYWDQCRLHLLGSHIDGTTFCLDLILLGSFVVGFLLPVADEHVLANISPIAKITNPRRKKSQLKKPSYLLVFWPPVMSKMTLISPSLGRQGQLFIPNLKQKP